MLNVHPYEEPAYDLYTLAVETNQMGLGRVGTLKEPMTLEQFAKHVKKQLDVPAVRVVGDKNAKVKKWLSLAGMEINIYMLQNDLVLMYL